MARLTAEHDDIQAALRWAVELAESDLAMRVIAGAGWYWFLRGHQDSSGWVERALTLGGDTSDETRALALMIAGFNAFGLSGDHQQALDHFARAVELIGRLEQAGRPLRHPTLAVADGLSRLFHGDNRGGLAGMRRLADHEDPWVRAISHMMAGICLENLGESGRAEAELGVALEGFRQLGERWGTGHVLAALADRSSWRGDDETAIAYLEEAGTTRCPGPFGCRHAPGARRRPAHAG